MWMPTYGETPSNLRISHHATPVTCYTCSLLRGGRAKLLQRRVDRAYLDFGCSWRTAVCGHGANWYLYVVYLSRRCLGRYVCWRIAWCGVWGVGVSPYVGVRMGPIGWNYGGPLIGKKTTKKKLKVKQSRQTRLYPGFIRPKTGTMRFGPMTGLVGCAFGLIVGCTCFWSQTDQVHLFLAATLFFSLDEEIQ